MKKGKFIVIEGTDGSGKKTQADILLKRLRDESRDVSIFDFPQYGNKSAHFVERYLRGEYGGLEEVGPHKASIFYALDRFEAGEEIKKVLDSGGIALSNRYVGSNMGHQGAKFDDSFLRQEYFKWLYDLEFGLLGIPRPDLNIVLFVPPEVGQKLVDKKDKRDYTKGKKRDLHEENIDHLKKTAQVYREMVGLFPTEFVLVDCTDEGELMSIEDIHERVWDLVKKHIS
ncbi:MAG: thymidylate kinase [Candidatus Harrisonbacteria bacterium CG10_big_fil_rev_8_21_14_0_10_44_23]|uniref:Thymidylate kinase n=1 Tax=Candidatus Harrisonbacteria bacterium CG10_big_fil_rev_8_21_14_0_10_44_23 TaxID=1974585 RepID=A0A2H0UQY3_9BACT|nr:MAG: thymidylate kinase [Candidatus Harrisonbacteria bacterium CG10_big_fil_rev_8_21_14_0_10_44_23]